MYIPKQFDMQAQSDKVAFMRQHSFASLVTSVGGRPVATHIPFVIRVQGDELVLVSHLSAVNEQAQHFAGETCLVIFSGPHAYISPKHYDKIESVPTWNYVAVHAYGTVELLPHDEQKLDALEEMIATYEPGYREQWDGLSDKYKQGMIKGIVAFQINVQELQGQEKLSQNKNSDEKQRIITSLSHSDFPEEQSLAEYMRRK